MLIYDDDKELTYNKNTHLYELVGKTTKHLVGRFTPETIHSSVEHRFLGSSTNGIIHCQGDRPFNINDTLLIFDYDPKNIGKFNKDIKLDIREQFKIERSNVYFLKEKEPISQIIIKNVFDIKESHLYSNFGGTLSSSGNFEIIGNFESEYSKLQGRLSEFDRLILKSSSIKILLVGLVNYKNLENYVIRGKKGQIITVKDSDISVVENSDFSVNDHMIIENSILTVNNKVEVDTLLINNNKKYDNAISNLVQDTKISDVIAKEIVIKGHPVLSLSRISLPNGVIRSTNIVENKKYNFINKIEDVRTDSNCNVLIEITNKKENPDYETDTIETLIKDVEIHSPIDSSFNIKIRDRGVIDGIKINNTQKTPNKNKIDLSLGKNSICRNLYLDIHTNERLCDIDISEIRSNTQEQSVIRIEDFSKKPSTIIMTNNEFRQAELSIRNEEGVLLNNNIFEGEVEIVNCPHISNSKLIDSKVKHSDIRRSEILSSSLTEISDADYATIKESNLEKIDKVAKSSIRECMIENVKNIEEAELEGVVAKYNIKQEEITPLYDPSKNISKRIEEVKSIKISHFEDF